MSLSRAVGITRELHIHVRHIYAENPLWPEAHPAIDIDEESLDFGIYYFWKNSDRFDRGQNCEIGSAQVPRVEYFAIERELRPDYCPVIV